MSPLLNISPTKICLWLENQLAVLNFDLQVAGAKFEPCRLC